MKTIFIDLIILCGLGLIGWGLWEYQPWMSKVVTGGLLFALGVASAWR